MNTKNNTKRTEVCGACKEEQTIAFECRFCSESRMCRECGEEHRNWCQVKDEWNFISEKI